MEISHFSVGPPNEPNIKERMKRKKQNTGKLTTNNHRCFCLGRWHNPMENPQPSLFRQQCGRLFLFFCSSKHFINFIFRKCVHIEANGEQGGWWYNLFMKGKEKEEEEEDVNESKTIKKTKYDHIQDNHWKLLYAYAWHGIKQGNTISNPSSMLHITSSGWLVTKYWMCSSYYTI